MRWHKVSEAGEAALGQLRDASKRWFSRSRFQIKALRGIRLLHEQSLIPALLPFLLDWSRAVRIEAAFAVETLLESLDAPSFSVLDQHLRDSSEWDTSSKWGRLSPGQLAALDLGSHRTAALLAASFHHNGYVRQFALQELDREESSGREIPYFLLRLSDWAEPVRTTAERSLATRIVDVHRGQFLAHLGLIARLSIRLRSSESSALDGIARLLAEDIPALLRTAAASADGMTWKFATRLARKVVMNDRAQQAALFEAMLQGKERRVRMQAAVWLAAPDAPPDLASAYLPQLLTDASAVTRKLALGWCAERKMDGISAILHAGLLDRSGKVRALAQFYLPRRESYDVAAFYREAILQNTTPTLIAAIEGLGETGVADDARLVVPHASSSRIAIRKAALRALARLDAACCCELFLEALQDVSSGVSRQAFLALRSAAGALSPETVEAILQGTRHPHVRQRSLSLMRSLPKWDSVRLLVKYARGTDDADPLRTQATIYLREWLAGYNRTQVQPSAAQIAALRELVSVCADRLYQTQARELKSLVGELQERQK